ncbi:hypothetical protein I6N91_03195 [Arthrobacter sp. MSA 4-2]|uniref:hypothetical protein n=1 Tax=Arthrobacter sp. MSA 4-2 TaxID=2794349 RepID=UPI0018E728F3|nr:hypothetical protein [Arthrobacter sp. MSA 4-2]MBJ2119980.1 hypothetical protein [Arthrobacter sp. MSA 4-2]
MTGAYGSWQGTPPSADRFTPPIQLEQPAEGIHWTPEKAPPVWAELTYENGSRKTVKGLAMAWTEELVQLQWVEFSRARTAGAEASACRRNPHRDG